MEQNFHREVGARIRGVREAMSLTREDFSELCDISNSFLTDIELGKKGLTVKTLSNICNGSHVSADYFIFGSDAPQGCSAVLALLGNLEPKYLDSAVKILQEFITAVHME